MGLYERIKEAAARKGLSVNRLEKEMGLPRSSISKYNRHKPSIDKITDIANFLGISVDELQDTKSEPINPFRSGQFSSGKTINAVDAILGSIDLQNGLADFIDEQNRREMAKNISIPVTPVTNEEKQLLDFYRSLNEDGKTLALAQLRTIANMPEYIKNTELSAE